MNEQKIALVTGGNKGIGFEICRQLGQQGITILLGARDEERGQEATNQLIKEGITAHYIHLDMDDAETFHQAERFIAHEFGHLDILINNAGSIFETSAHIDVLSLPEVRKTFDLNFFSQIRLTKTLLPLIEKSTAGRIVNQSSILGSLTVNANSNSGLLPEFKLLGYNASKAALNMFTILLADQLKEKNIKVNSAHPGWVNTQLGGEKAPLTVEEGAKTAVELALLPDDGPTGGFFHLEQSLPW